MKDWTTPMLIVLLIVVGATAFMFWAGNAAERVEILGVFKLIVAFVVGASGAGTVGYVHGFTKGKTS